MEVDLRPICSYLVQKARQRDAGENPLGGFRIPGDHLGIVDARENREPFKRPWTRLRNDGAVVPQQQFTPSCAKYRDRFAFFYLHHERIREHPPNVRLLNPGMRFEALLHLRRIGREEPSRAIKVEYCKHLVPGNFLNFVDLYGFDGKKLICPDDQFHCV